MYVCMYIHMYMCVCVINNMCKYMCYMHTYLYPYVCTCASVRRSVSRAYATSVLARARVRTSASPHVSTACLTCRQPDLCTYVFRIHASLSAY